MRIHEIVVETASAGATGSASIASVSFPMTPGTSKKKQRQAVDPFGYTVNKRKVKDSVDPVYKHPVIKR